VTLEVTPLDLEQASFPPSLDDLAYRPQLMAMLIEGKDPNKQLAPEDLALLAFFGDQLAAEAGLVQIPRTKIKAVLKDQKWRRMRPESIAEALELAKYLGAHFVGQLKVVPIKGKTPKAKAWIKVIKVDSEQLVYSDSLVVNGQQPGDAVESIRPKLQAHFPRIGWISETRGKRQMALVSLGPADGVKRGRKVVFRSRRITRGLEKGVNTGHIEYSDVLAKGVVVSGGPEGSWVAVDKAGRNNIRKGDLVFTSARN